MKTLFLLLLPLFVACASSRPGPDTPVVPIDRLDDARPATGDVVVKVPAGTRLPVDVTFDAPFARQEGGAPALTRVFDRDVYWYLASPERVSFDGTTWRRLSELYRGRLDVSVRKTAEQGPAAAVGVSLRPR